MNEMFVDENGRQVEVQWIVKLYGIDWDSGDYDEYDVSDLPKNLQVEVHAYDEAGAIENALREAGEYTYSTLIRGTEQIVAKPKLV
jgi:hypothetical protein